MKVFYFNDSNNEQRVFVKHVQGAGTVLKPSESVTIEIDVQPNQILFVTTWGHLVLFSTASEDIL